MIVVHCTEAGYCLPCEAVRVLRNLARIQVGRDHSLSGVVEVGVAVHLLSLEPDLSFCQCFLVLLLAKDIDVDLHVEYQAEGKYFAEEVENEDEHCIAGSVVVAALPLHVRDAGVSLANDQLPEVEHRPDDERCCEEEIDDENPPDRCTLSIKLVVHPRPLMLRTDC